MSDCGCKERQARLNAAVPGLGDNVALFLSPIAPVVNRLSKEENAMPELLKPDMKAIVWLAIGAFVVPFVLAKLR